MSYGLDPDGFWDLTPREIVVRLEGARAGLQAEHDGRIWLAWHVAAFTRAKELPDLESLISRSAQGAGADQDPDEQTAALDQLFLAMGGDPKQLAQVRAER